MKARTILIAAAAVAIGVSSTSCKIVKKSEYHNSKNVTKTMDISDFNAISNEFMSDIKYTQGPTSFRVSAPEFIMNVMTVEVRDSILIIGTKDEDIHIDKIEDIEIVCSSPSLKSVQVNGMGDFEWKGGTADDLKLVVNGMGDLKWENGRCDSLEMQINGMGDIECKNITGNSIIGTVAGHGDIDISGKFLSGRLSIEGLGDINAKELDCPALNITVDGMGKVKR